jgi:hypothetical protein
MYIASDTLKKVYISIEEEKYRKKSIKRHQKWLSSGKSASRIKSLENHFTIMHVSWHCFHATYFIDLLTIDCVYAYQSCVCLHITLQCEYQVYGEVAVTRNLPLTFNTCFLNPEITVVSLHSTSCDIWLLTFFF